MTREERLHSLYSTIGVERKNEKRIEKIAERVIADKHQLDGAEKIIKNIAELFGVSFHDLATDAALINDCMDQIIAAADLVDKNIREQEKIRKEKEKIRSEARAEVAFLRAKIARLQREINEMTQVMESAKKLFEMEYSEKF